ncbi:MAG: TRAP transporter large permease subunit [Clostridiales Family XIII bacterium]|jgi:tripartite ATP-independent transporter DctM subunit|nr:TRAP transporter large permease subunit [Clostridiales Family XIII bacterium]
MEWWQSLCLAVVMILVLMAARYPVAFVFLTVNLGMFAMFMNGFNGMKMFTVSLLDSLNTFTMVAVPMFMLMGDVLFRSGMAMRAIGAMERILGRVPGRLSVLASVVGIIFAATSGSVMANTAMLGTLLVPEMEKKGYAKKMIFGPIMGVSGLAMLIPPSALAVLYASMAQISVGKVLIGGIVPGLIMGVLFIAYIIVTTTLHPELAPSYHIKATPALEKLRMFASDVLPLGVLIFLVIGTIIMGIATPLEAAALGALGAFLLCVYNRTLTWKLASDCALSTLKTVGMVFAVVAGTVGFGQMLAFTGAVSNLSKLALGMDVHPVVIIIITQVIVLVLGFFIDVVPIMMMTIPIFYPIILQLGYDPIWFACLNLINMSMANITPPFGMILFVMKGVAPKGTTMQQIYSSVMPYIVIDAFVIVLMVAFPKVILWLPGAMYGG